MKRHALALFCILALGWTFATGCAAPPAVQDRHLASASAPTPAAPPEGDAVTTAGPTLAGERPAAGAARYRGWTVPANNESGASRPPMSQGSMVLGGQEITYTLRYANPLEFPGQVDSNSPAFWEDGELVVFNSAVAPTRMTGSALARLSEPEGVTSVNRLDSAPWWLEAVWEDRSSGMLYGWYHLEPDDLPCLTAPTIGAAISDDGGLSWADKGTVLESGYDIDCNYDNGYFVGGHGDFSVILDQEQEYFYFLYSNYGGPVTQQGVALARSAFEDRGQPGMVYKLFDDTWDQPGIGGQVTPVFPTDTGWAGPSVDAFWGPSVHWNRYLGAYVTLLNRAGGEEWKQEGIYISFSKDLLAWTGPQKIMETQEWYPQVIGLGRRGTDREAGRVARLYVGGQSNLMLQLHIAPVALNEGPQGR